MASLFDLLPISVPLELKHPVSGEPLGVFLNVVGPDSVQFRKVRNAVFQRRALRAATNPMTIDELAEENDELVASTIVGWSDDAYFGGAFTPEAAKAIIANPGFSWLKKQVDAFTDINSNFFRQSADPAREGTSADAQT